MNIYQKRVNKITNDTLILMDISYYRARKLSKKCIKHFGNIDFIQEIGVSNINNKILYKLIKEL